MSGFSIDPAALDDLVIWLILLLILQAAALFNWVRYDMRRLRITPDPFFYSMGDVPNLPPLPAGSILEARETNRSARRAAPAGQGSGGNGKTSQGPAAASPYRGRERRAF